MHARRLVITALALLGASLSFTTAADEAQVTVNGGALRGHGDGEVQAFLGIPYAAPPVGALRWQPPRAAEPWSGVREATQFGPACTQGEDRLFGLTPAQRGEDCLYLNVWAPPRGTQQLPVMVWLHGGAHRIGASSIASYNGARLAARGVIVVTLNYRLGYLGYFAHPALGDAPGNFGLMDQIAALQWVRDNIAAFGGDPAQVTVFGESAGGADILYLLTSAAGRDLFRAAIIQSGGGWGKPLPRAKMQDKVVKALANVGVAKNADAATLRALPAQKLIEAQAGDRNLGFGPFIDGHTVHEVPSRVFTEGRQHQVPLIIGSNDGEGSLLRFRPPGWRDRLLLRLPRVSDWYPGTAVEARAPLLFRDVVFSAPARWIAAHHKPTWLYRYNHLSASQRGRDAGAAHAAEIAYVFDTVDSLRVFKVTVDDEDRRLAAQLADCWASFAKTLKPDCGVAWAPYRSGEDKALIVERGLRVAPLPDRDALDGVTKTFGPGSWLGG